jgi:hypothetical protein
LSGYSKNENCRNQKLKREFASHHLSFQFVVPTETIALGAIQS